MKSESENAVDVCYLTLPVDSPDQQVSLINYLNAHGIEAGADDNRDGVTCPFTQDDAVAEIRMMHRSWRRFWEHSDEEVFGLSVYVKPAHFECTEP